MSAITSRLGRWQFAGLVGALMLAALLAGCGGAMSSPSAAPPAHSASNGSITYGPATGSGSSSSGSSTSSNSKAPVAQYLIKSLNVSMTAPDPRKAASDLQTWILAADPKAVSAGMNYSQNGSSYDVSMTFDIQAAIYPQVESYLASYAQGHGGALLSLQETVQDVTNDYIDSQSRLANLRAEQQRLQTLMSQAQSMSDVLQIEQRLSDVEGQIEDTEAHLTQLSGETTFYTVQIQLTPLDSVITTPSQPWSALPILQQAWSAAVAFGQFLLTLLIWLGVFAIYIVPVLALIWGVRRLLARRRTARAQATLPPTPPAGPATTSVS
jgi:hypothetical protein